MLNDIPPQTRSFRESKPSSESHAGYTLKASPANRIQKTPASQNPLENSCASQDNDGNPEPHYRNVLT